MQTKEKYTEPGKLDNLAESLANLNKLNELSQLAKLNPYPSNFPDYDSMTFITGLQEYQDTIKQKQAHLDNFLEVLQISPAEQLMNGLHTDDATQLAQSLRQYEVSMPTRLAQAQKQSNHTLKKNYLNPTRTAPRTVEPVLDNYLEVLQISPAEQLLNGLHTDDATQLALSLQQYEDSYGSLTANLIQAQKQPHIVSNINILDPLKTVSQSIDTLIPILEPLIGERNSRRLEQISDFPKPYFLLLEQNSQPQANNAKSITEQMQETVSIINAGKFYWELLNGGPIKQLAVLDLAEPLLKIMNYDTTQPLIELQEQHKNDLASVVDGGVSVVSSYLPALAIPAWLTGQVLKTRILHGNINELNQPQIDASDLLAEHLAQMEQTIRSQNTLSSQTTSGIQQMTRSSSINLSSQTMQNLSPTSNLAQSISHTNRANLQYSQLVTPGQLLSRLPQPEANSLEQQKLAVYTQLGEMATMSQPSNFSQNAQYTNFAQTTTNNSTPLTLSIFNQTSPSLFMPGSEQNAAGFPLPGLPETQMQRENAKPPVIINGGITFHVEQLCTKEEVEKIIEGYFSNLGDQLGGAAPIGSKV